jgi:hypothetical protein
MAWTLKSGSKLQDRGVKVFKVQDHPARGFVRVFYVAGQFGAALYEAGNDKGVHWKKVQANQASNTVAIATNSTSPAS